MRRLIRALIRPGDDSLFSQVMSAGFWAGIFRIALRLSLTVRTVILARLLAPDDFGVMAVATISILLVERITQSGISQALIQKSDDIRPYLNTAWTLQIVRGLAMAGMLALSAPWIAQFFGIPEALAVIRVLSISVAIKGFVNIAVVIFTKELMFDKLFVFQLGFRGTEIVVSIGAAFLLRNVWALVLGILASSVMQLVLSYVIHDFRPRIAWVWDQVKQLFEFGKWVFASQLLSFTAGSLDDILVGRMLGAGFLGWYRMAFNFSQAIASEVTQVTYQVAFPTYSKLQTAAEKLRITYLGTVHLVAFIGFPVAVGTILVAPDLTYGLLGSKWAPIIPPMQILSIAGLIRGIAGTTGPLFQSLGRPDLPARFGLAYVVIMAPLLYPSIDRFGMNGAAGTLVIAGVITGIPALWLAFSKVNANWRDLKQALVHPALNTTVMAAVVLATRFILVSDPTALSFLLLTASGGLTYLVAVYVSTRTLGYAAPGDLLKRVQRAAS